MGNLTKTTSGALAKTKKQNEIIQKVNAIENMTVRAATDEEAPRLLVSDNGSELIVPGGTGGGGGGGGLPEYPGDAPSDNIKAPLVWDDDNGEARWLVGETVDASDPNTYIDIFGYNPDPANDAFGLVRFEVLDGVICENGTPVSGKVIFSRTS